MVCVSPQDYDDSYCIEYARQSDGYIVTNDRYWDAVNKEPKAQRSEALTWIRSHCISFAFAGDRFMPNPDFAGFCEPPAAAGGSGGDEGGRDEDLAAGGYGGAAAADADAAELE